MVGWVQAAVPLVLLAELAAGGWDKCCEVKMQMHAKNIYKGLWEPERGHFVDFDFDCSRVNRWNDLRIFDFEKIERLELETAGTLHKIMFESHISSS